jgi:hypothetical protein
VLVLRSLYYTRAYLQGAVTGYYRRIVHFRELACECFLEGLVQAVSAVICHAYAPASPASACLTSRETRDIGTSCCLLRALNDVRKLKLFSKAGCVRGGVAVLRGLERGRRVLRTLSL